jgi:hypothetical protein
VFTRLPRGRVYAWSFSANCCSAEMTGKDGGATPPKAKPVFAGDDLQSLEHFVPDTDVYMKARKVSSSPSAPMDTSLSVPSKTVVPGSGRTPLAGVGAAGQWLARARESASESRARHERRRLSCRISLRPSRGLHGQLPKRTLQLIARHAIDFSPSNEATAYSFVDG